MCIYIYIYIHIHIHTNRPYSEAPQTRRRRAGRQAEGDEESGAADSKADYMI